MRLATSLRFPESGRVNSCADMSFPAPSGLSLVMSASYTATVERQRFGLIFNHIALVELNLQVQSVSVVHILLKWVSLSRFEQLHLEPGAKSVKDIDAFNFSASTPF